MRELNKLGFGLVCAAVMWILFPTVIWPQFCRPFQNAANLGAAK